MNTIGNGQGSPQILEQFNKDWASNIAAKNGAKIGLLLKNLIANPAITDQQLYTTLRNKDIKPREGFLTIENHPININIMFSNYRKRSFEDFYSAFQTTPQIIEPAPEEPDMKTNAPEESFSQSMENGSLKTIDFNGHRTHVWINDGVEIKTFLQQYFGLKHLEVNQSNDLINIKSITPYQASGNHKTEKLEFKIGDYQALFGDEQVMVACTSIQQLAESFNTKVHNETLGFIDNIKYSLLVLKKNLSKNTSTTELIKKIDELSAQVHYEWKQRIHQPLIRSDLQKLYLENKYYNQIEGIQRFDRDDIWTQITMADNAVDCRNSTKFHISISRGHFGADRTFLPDEDYILKTHDILIKILTQPKYRKIITHFKFQNIHAIRSFPPKLTEHGYLDDNDSSLNVQGKEFVIYARSLNDNNRCLWINLLTEIETSLNDNRIRTGYPSLADHHIHGSCFIETRAETNFLGAYLGALDLANLGMTRIEASMLRSDKTGEVIYSISNAPSSEPVHHFKQLNFSTNYSNHEMDLIYQNLRKNLTDPVKVGNFSRSSIFSLIVGGWYSYFTDAVHDYHKALKLLPAINALNPLVDKIDFHDIKLDEDYLSKPLKKAAQILAIFAENGKLSNLKLGKIAPAIYHGFFLKKAQDVQINLQDPFETDKISDADFVSYIVECALRTQEVQIRYMEPRHLIDLTPEQIRTTAKQLYHKLFN